MNQLLLGVDVGATSIKAGLFSIDGRLVALASRRNTPEPDPDGSPGWMIWNPDILWLNVCTCIREVLSKAGDASQVQAVACTGFGTDGLPLENSGTPLYPFISWHCGRTVPQREKMALRVSDLEAFQITGYHNYHINTANRFLWFREHRPDVLDKAYRWLWVQDFIAHKLSGEFSTECTIASTAMLLDMGKRTWSSRMLGACAVDPAILPSISEAGTQIGAVTAKAASETGLKAGTPVVTGGHDCEVAVLGAGASDADTWIDITGTWEILIATMDHFAPTPEHHASGLDFECHARPGQWICQSLMIAGAVTEWVRANFYRDVPDEHVYKTMFSEAETPSNGLYVLPAFMRGMGPDASKHALGTILGLQTMTSRGQIVRAALEGLCYQLRKQIGAIGNAVGRAPKRLRVVGGGQKNSLWLQLKADITGLPIEITTNPEVTLLGVALLAGVGAGVYESIDEALRQIHFSTEPIAPSMERNAAYKERFDRVFALLPSQLESAYGAINQLI
ncbi:MAG: hypothetical protein IT366_24265 [Candidatus Hydrogenedentes bacterium]|nr:hypothetical protein [Candidatus Hydrogenedentota bacterium]